MILLYKFYQLEIINTFIALNARQLRVRTTWQLDTAEKHRPIPQSIRFSENKTDLIKYHERAPLC